MQQQQQQQQQQQNKEQELLYAQSRESSLSLSISHMQGAFMLLLLGLIPAGLVFGGELITRRVWQKEQNCN